MTADPLRWPDVDQLRLPGVRGLGRTPVGERLRDARRVARLPRPVDVPAPDGRPRAGFGAGLPQRARSTCAPEFPPRPAQPDPARRRGAHPAVPLTGVPGETG